MESVLFGDAFTHAMGVIVYSTVLVGIISLCVDMIVTSIKHIANQFKNKL